MKVTMKRVSEALPEYERIERLYNESFPADERAPFRLLMKKSLRKNVDFRAVYRYDEFIGFAYTVTEGDLSYLFYLCVDSGLRGRGNGSLILRAVKEKYKGNRIFLALEQLDGTAPNYDERFARRRFYEKNGFFPANLTIREGTVVYDVMSLGGAIFPVEYKMMMRNYFGFFMSLLVSMNIKKAD